MAHADAPSCDAILNGTAPAKGLRCAVNVVTRWAGGNYYELVGNDEIGPIRLFESEQAGNVHDKEINEAREKRRVKAVAERAVETGVCKTLTYDWEDKSGGGGFF